ncbi:MAG: FAD/FMN-containing dehydrogenase [Saprospiraceae bacterium]
MSKRDLSQQLNKNYNSLSSHIYLKPFIISFLASITEKFKTAFRTDEETLDRFSQDWTKHFTQKPCGVFFPSTTEELAKFVKIANEHKIGLVPAGGLTGLSGGATAMTKEEVIISLEKMTEIIEFSSNDNSINVQCGIITSNVQKFVHQHNLFFPVDFGAKDSSTIGGNLATNVGGINVIRYGNIRNWVSGMTVVTGKGDILKLNNGLIKNATGYDLKNLFIGSEGTLGIITEATLQLTQSPKHAISILLALPKAEFLPNVLNVLRKGASTIASEFFTEQSVQYVMSYLDIPHPFQEASPYYLLIELEENPETLEESGLFEKIEILYEKEFITNDLLALDASDRKKVWCYRENITLGISGKTPYKMDVSVRPSKIADFISQLLNFNKAHFPNFEFIIFGHVGDGNIHISITKPDAIGLLEFKKECQLIVPQIFEIIQNFNGSISAEHGVGQLKKAYLEYSKSNEEIAYMKGIKYAFDPVGIMNPGKIFDV